MQAIKVKKVTGKNMTERNQNSNKTCKLCKMIEKSIDYLQIFSILVLATMIMLLITKLTVEAIQANTINQSQNINY